MSQQLPEYWLRGPVEGIPAPLQPVAHALLQASSEIQEALKYFPDDALWTKPKGLASVGFHLQHLRGVLDRLFTYAKGEQLGPGQLEALAREGKPAEGESLATLLSLFQQQVIISIEALRKTDPGSLGEPRGVGRAQLPSTVAGLLFHAAEHTMRHTGQLLVTAKWVAPN